MLFFLLSLFFVAASVKATSLRGDTSPYGAEINPIYVCTFHGTGGNAKRCESNSDCVNVEYSDLRGSPCDSGSDCIECHCCEDTYYGGMCYPCQSSNEAPPTPANATSN